MDFEDFQKAWQSQDASAKVTIKADVLLNEVRRNQRQFQRTIFCRDVREVSVIALMTVGFLVWGILWQWWSLYLLSFCCLSVGVFFVVDRLIQRRKQPNKNESLQNCIEISLLQVNHQIWLLKNVFWWYLLPPLIGIGAVAGSFVWSQRHLGLAAMIVSAGVYIFTYGFTYGVVYWANQRTVRKELDPRRKELEALLASLK
jgi:hypothetical protein